VAAVWLLHYAWSLVTQFGSVVVTLLLAWIIHLAALRPVTFLRRLRLPRVVAASIVYVWFGAAIGVICFYFLPPLFAQLAEAVTSFSELVTEIPDVLGNLRLHLIEVGVPPAQIDQFLEAASTWLLTFAENLGSGILGQTGTLLSGLVLALITLVISFNILISWDAVVSRTRLAMPDNWRQSFDRGLAQIERTFAGWLQGQVVTSAIYAGVVIAAMAVAGVPFGILLGVSAGLLMCLPLIGNAYGVLAPAIVAGATRLELALWVGVPLLVVVLVIENVLKPRVMGSSIGVSPMVVIVSVIGGGVAAGFWGIVFAIPIGALLWSFARWGASEFLEVRRAASAAPTASTDGPATPVAPEPIATSERVGG